MKYVPKQAQGDDAIFEGSIEIAPFGMEEKLEAAIEMGFDISAGDDGEMNTKAASKGNIAYMLTCVRMAKPRYISVDIKRKGGGNEYKSYAELDADPICHEIIKEVALGLYTGFKMGND